MDFSRFKYTSIDTKRKIRWTQIKEQTVTRLVISPFFPLSIRGRLPYFWWSNASAGRPNHLDRIINTRFMASFRRRVLFNFNISWPLFPKAKTIFESHSCNKYVRGYQFDVQLYTLFCLEQTEILSTEYLVYHSKEYIVQNTLSSIPNKIRDLKFLESSFPGSMTSKINTKSEMLLRWEFFSTLYPRSLSYQEIQIIKFYIIWDFAWIDSRNNRICTWFLFELISTVSFEKTNTDKIS